MDTLRGTFDNGALADQRWDEPGAEGPELDAPRDLPPLAIGRDERRMQVRAYNHWASLLGERMFPNIADLNPQELPDFGPHSVLLDFTDGIDNPWVRFLGEKLERECFGAAPIARLLDVPPRSLLSRITDHYMQILANQAPIGFEAEFVNHAGVAILYRGILLPFSSDDATIDYIYGVINWKEMADQLTADALLLELDEALELGAAMESRDESAPRIAEPVTDWADSPANEDEAENDVTARAYLNPFDRFEAALGEADDLPDFSQYALDDDDEDYDEDEGEAEGLGYNFASLADYIEAPAKKAMILTALEPVAFPEPEAAADEGFDYPELTALEEAFAAVPADFSLAQDEADEVAEEAQEHLTDDPDEEPADLAADAFAADLADDAGLYDCLAEAREFARVADSTEDRSRSALYAAVSRAYDFSLAAAAAPEDYAELIADSGLAVQERAPMTPVVKLVFGPDYDKTRLTEYAAVLTHAHRLKLFRGSLAGYLAETEGGVKAIVKAERRLRREAQGKPVDEPGAIREALAQALRDLEAISLEELDGGASEFALVLIRRDEIGCAEILGEVPEDVALIERAARKIVG
jgi:hypothetical protein